MTCFDMYQMLAMAMQAHAMMPGVEQTMHGEDELETMGAT